MNVKMLELNIPSISLMFNIYICFFPLPFHPSQLPPIARALCFARAQHRRLWATSPDNWA